MAVSIETKTETRTAEEAKVQLGIWVAAQIGRIRSLIAEISPPTHGPSTTKASVSKKSVKRPKNKVDEGTQESAHTRRKHARSLLADLVFPLLYVHSEKWEVFFASPSPSPPSNTLITIYSSVTLGDTSPVFGTYQLLQGLRVISRWVDTKVRMWWEGLLEH